MLALPQIPQADALQSFLAELGLPDLVLEVFRLPSATHLLILEMHRRGPVPSKRVYIAVNHPHHECVAEVLVEMHVPL